MTSVRPKKIKFEKIWGNFSEKITNLLEMKEFVVKGMDLYSDVYDLCTSKPSLQGKLNESLEQFFTAYVEAKREVILSSNDSLAIYVEIWSKFRNGVIYVNSLCKYLNGLNENKDGSKPGHTNESRPSVEAMALSIWRQRIVEEIAANYGDRLLYQISLHLEANRNYDQSSPELVKAYAMSLVTLDEFAKEGQKDVYKENFEKKILTQTREYYGRESADMIAKAEMPHYMKHVLKRLKEEEQRAKELTDSQTHEKLIKEVEQQLISVHFERFHSECSRMIQNEMLQDFGRMYELLVRVPEGVKPMLKILEDHVTEVGLQELEKLGAVVSKNPQDYFDLLLRLHSKYTTILDSAFRLDSVFLASVDKAFRVIINDSKRNPEAKGPEILARCCDLFLKKSSKTVSEGEIEEKLNGVVLLFKFIDDKDIFQKFYSRMLAKRLIYEMSLSDDAESNMISRLKTTCGYEYTSKLQRMFTDISVSKDFNGLFHESLRNRSKSLGVDFHVLILTAGAWPITSTPTTSFSIPSELEKCIPVFQEFYNSRHSGRKLTWLHHLSRGDVKLTYLPKRYELQLTAFQVAVLLLFNFATSLPFSDIHQQTRLNEQELLRILKSLVDVKVLNSSDVSPTSIFELNMNFSSKRMKLKVSAPMQTDTQAEKQETQQQIDTDRQLYLQALVVRILKTRKKLHHNQLVEQIVREAKSRFAPSIGTIKKCVEGLIEKGYMERDGQNRDEYVYLA